MAIIYCPHCGKQITDRMEKCPHCQSVLLQQTVQETVIKEHKKTLIKGSIINGVSSVLLTSMVLLVWYFVTLIYIIQFMGDDAGVALDYAKDLFLSKVFFLLPVVALILGIISVLLNKKAIIQLVVGIVFTALFATIGYILQNSAVDRDIINGKIPPQIIMYVKSLALGYGFAFPMLLGSLSVAGFVRTIKHSLVIQALLTVVFVVLTFVLGILAVVVFALGTSGVSGANFVSAILIYIISVLFSKGFRQLITPKKLR